MTLAPATTAPIIPAHVLLGVILCSNLPVYKEQHHRPRLGKGAKGKYARRDRSAKYRRHYENVDNPLGRNFRSERSATDYEPAACNGMVVNTLAGSRNSHNYVLYCTQSVGFSREPELQEQRERNMHAYEADGRPVIFIDEEYGDAMALCGGRRIA